MRLASAVADPLSLIPWPAQLTLVGSLIVAIVIILRWQSWQVQKGELIPRTTHEEALAVRDKQIEAEQLRADEWRAAHTASEAAREVERETTKEAVQSNKFVDYLVQQLPVLAPRIGAVKPPSDVPQKVDNGGVEVTP